MTCCTWVQKSDRIPYQASPDAFIAAADVNGDIHLLSVGRSRVVGLLKGNSRPIAFLDSKAYSDGMGSLLLSFCPEEGTVKIWKLDELLTSSIENANVSASNVRKAADLTINVSKKSTHAVRF